MDNVKELLKCDAVLLEYHTDLKLYVITDCEGNEFVYRAEWRARRKYDALMRKYA